MTACSDRPLDPAPASRMTLRNPRALVFTLRVPADPRRALQRAQRQRRGRRVRREDPLRAVLHARDRDLQPRHRVLHDADPRAWRPRATRGCSSACAAPRCRWGSTSARGWRARRRPGIGAVAAAVRGRGAGLRRARSTARTLPAAIVTLLLGAACLASLGVAVASVVKSADQAMPVAQLTFLPISFISGIWFPLDGAPDWLVTVSHIFPLSHIVKAFGSCFVPGTTGSGFQARRSRP